MISLCLPHGFALRPYSSLDEAWVAAAHIAHYRTLERFDASFDEVVHGALADIGTRLGRDRTFGLILESADGARSGSIFACDMGSAARLRLFFLEPELQGRGLGKAMLGVMMDAISAAGFFRIEVSTFDAHTAACRLYLRSGFTEEERTPCVAFGRRMVQLEYARDLPVP